MGVLRFFLAFCVVNIHGKLLGVNLFPADAAVQAFYVISGFYMAMVLNEKYAPPHVTYVDFILSRIFRIAPAYFVVFFLTILTAIISAGIFNRPIAPLEQWKLLPNLESAKTLTTLLLPQFLILGLDFLHFLTLDEFGSIRFTSNFLHEPIQLWRLVAVPQAWSLAIELYFYCIAPFIVRRSLLTIFSAITLSFLIRLVLAAVFENRFDPWSYRFFPSEIMYFLSGSLAYRISTTAASSASRTIKWVFTVACFVIIIASGTIGRYGLDGRLIFYSPLAIGILFLAIPSLFLFTKNIKADRYIGELSYPLYISHMLIIWITELVFHLGSIQFKLVVGIGSVLTAVLIFELIDRRVDDFRHRTFSARKN